MATRRKTTPTADSSTVGEFIPCTIKHLPEAERYPAALTAIAENPLNKFALRHLPRLLRRNPTTEDLRESIAVLTEKYWSAHLVDLTVGFLENIPAALADRILSHMNAWGPRCNVRFSMVTGSPSKAQVRITLNGQGYWSFLGTDILHISSNQPTMCLQGFSMNTPESEYRRVVRHETGHTLGCPHEHLRAALVAKLDRAKTISYFERTQGWSEQDVVFQVLSPISETSLTGASPADPLSIMCYQLPGSITVDGKPIPGGSDIEETDYKYMSGIYPPIVSPPPPPPGPPPVGSTWEIKLPNGAVLAGTGSLPVISTK